MMGCTSRHLAQGAPAKTSKYISSFARHLSTAEVESDVSSSLQVVVRIRPPLSRELRGTGLRPYQCTTAVEPGERNVILSENLPAVVNQQGNMVTDGGALYNTYRFTFDCVYDQHCPQELVYRQSGQQGYNAAIIAYGQTGTGKTYTMEGAMEGPDRGIIPRTVEDIFTYIVNDPEPSSKYLVRSSYLQIYNEVVSDLLKPERSSLSIREDRRRGVFVEGLSEWVVRSPAEVYQLMQRGQALRATGATKLNEVSSRSHAVCVIIVEKCTTPGAAEEGAAGAPWSRSSSSTNGGDAAVPAIQSIKVGKLNLVDLAGSERVHVTGAVGRRLEESKKINASLSALGNVIAALTDRRERSHIPYRDSKLTRLLEDSLGGNCRTTMIATIAPSLEAFQESLSTLKFANRAKNIQNEAHVNEDVDQRTLLRKYERELRRLRDELARRSRNVVDKRALLVAEEQAKRAEADKLAALTALQERSREFLREKEEKRALELKIQAMQSQLLSGGSSGAALQEVPAVRAMLQREANKVKEHYEARIRALEAERQDAEGSASAEVDRYKQLLLKQRDIMIALTARLNERDERINSLQEELDAYDRYQRQLEDQLDAKTTELISLRKAAVEHAAASPAGLRGVDPSALQNALGDWAGQGGAPGSQHQHQHHHQQQQTGPPLDVASSASGALSGELAAGGGAGQAPYSTPFRGALPPGSQSAANGTLAGHPGRSGSMPGGGLIHHSLPPLVYSADGTAVELQGPDSQDVTPRGSVWSSSMGGGDPAPVGTPGPSAANGVTTTANEAPSASPGEIAELRAAALTAAKERSALQQILDSKVRVMLVEIINEVLLERLSALEALVHRVSEAIGSSSGSSGGGSASVNTSGGGGGGGPPSRGGSG
ncbi:Kif3C kinesin [Volvox carteri f. nagariensis]|uniref:Kinesin-like protein n=1 Tax=Volvox carteri f. nagariensis TaxID=3068 RepID=D8UBP7_VOLCA|nr:Kif3C kinesin [Volvox carteri f. nagariensis]EFJ42862.1 Kif3C kinesin [Volvox carteri f. nagariensis]|eukprot:XP_002956122.1 Kif3C kinesin [Volvox carteri f. nagariensis]